MPIERLFTQDERPLTSMAHAGIALCRVDPSQRHIGLLHREDGSGDVMLLHLAWHHDLRNQSPGRHYLWVDVPIPGPRLRQVAAICRNLWRSNRNVVPYAFSPPSDCFDALTGQFLLGPTRHGLTCATFVLAVFEAAGLPWVQYATWPDRGAEDRQWQELVIRLLKDGSPAASAEHIAAVSSEIGAVRFRPEEVAGAATLSDIPVAFPAAKQLGELVLEKLADNA